VIHMSVSGALLSAHAVSAVVAPIQALPAGLAEGLTGAVGIAILVVGGVIDVLAVRGEGLNQRRLALVVLIYFSGWLTVLDACHARGWWTGMVTDPGIMFLVRLAGLGLLAFLTMAVVGLVLKKAPVQVADDAGKKVAEHKDANKAKVTPTAMTWAAVTALFALAIPAGTGASNYAMYVLNAPGTFVSAILIRGAAHLVGSDGQALALDPGGPTRSGGAR
jgi:hypothetical protein